MFKISRVLCLACILSFMALPIHVLAAEAAKAGAPQANTPTKIDARSTQISVAHTGTDTIGTRLSTRLKEVFNSSNLFQLNEKNAPKIRLVLTTKAEFADRPHVGSVYSLVWVFSQSDAHLGYMLAQEVDVVNLEDVDGVAAKIVERTDGLSVKYGYLFK